MKQWLMDLFQEMVIQEKVLYENREAMAIVFKVLWILSTLINVVLIAAFTIMGGVYHSVLMPVVALEMVVAMAALVLVRKSFERSVDQYAAYLKAANS